MVIEKIREATSENHKKLEARLFPFVNGIESEKQYAQLLNAFYGYIQPLQEKISQFIDVEIVPDMEKRRNANLIINDLQQLAFVKSNKSADQLPVINDHASALGALYVLEGSTLGGKIISKTIAEKLGIDKALSFFNGYGKETGPMWKNFTQYLEHPNNLIHSEKIAYSATETFRLFGTWFENHLFTQK